MAEVQAGKAGQVRGNGRTGCQLPPGDCEGAELVARCQLLREVRHAHVLHVMCVRVCERVCVFGCLFVRALASALGVA